MLSEYMRSRKNNINLIQFIAAVLVIYSHAFPIAQGSNSGEIIKDLTQSRYSFGNLAVAVFFIYSGFLVSASFERRPSLCTYLKNRFFRIMPELIGVIFFSAFVLGPCMTSLSLGAYFKDSRLWQYLRNVFLFPLHWDLPGVFENNLYGTSVNGSLWTLPYQIGLYIGLGILGWLGLLRNKNAVGAGLIFFIFGYCFQEKLFPGVTHFWMMPLDAWMYLGMYFTAGMCAYAYRDQIPLNRSSAMLACLTLLVSFWLDEFFISISLFGTYLLLYFSYCTKPVDVPLSKLSYGVYIYSFPIQQLWTHVFGGKMNPYLNMALSIPCVLILAYCSDRLIEFPALKLKAQIDNIKFIPDGLNKMLSKIQQWGMRAVDIVLNISWRSFIVMLAVLSGMLWYQSSYIPTEVNFYSRLSLAPSRIFSNGWYPQDKWQSFRFIADQASVTLKRADGKNRVVVRGSIPGNFDDISSFNLYCNSEKIGEFDVLAGEEFSYEVPISQIPVDVTCEIVLQFNANHQWKEGELDQRQISACISYIGFCK